MAIKAADGLNIDIKHINQKTVSQTIDIMVKADPKLAWLKEAEQRGDVDWRLIKETHESFKYSHSSLGQGAMLAIIIIIIIIIIVTVLTAGTGTAATVGASAGTAASGAAAAAGASAATAATVGAAASAAATASFSAAVAQTAVSTINNKGDLGATFKDVFSSESLKGSTGMAMWAEGGSLILPCTRWRGERFPALPEVTSRPAPLRPVQPSHG